MSIANPRCPICGSEELHPSEPKLLIRSNKVHTPDGWHSQCLPCAGYYDSELNETPDRYDATKGWFRSC